MRTRWTHLPDDRSRTGRARLLLTLLVPLVTLAGAAAGLDGQRLERHVLHGDDVAIYNLAGRIILEAGTEPSVVVTVDRGGRDGDRLEIGVDRIDGRQAFVVRYPDRRIVYDGLGRTSRTQVRVRDDGSFYGGGGLNLFSGSTTTIVGSGRGTAAHADLRVQVPPGQRLAVHLAAGEARVVGTEAGVVLDVGAAAVVVEGIRGDLRVDAGSGPVRVTDAEGDIELDTGSGSVVVERVRGPRLLVDTGSGSVRGSDIAVERLTVDTGSGAVDLGAVRADHVLVDTGSGRVTLALAGPVRDLVIDTGSGPVDLTVPDGLNAELVIDTGSGGIDVDLPVRVLEQRRSYLRGQVGSGDGSIRVDTGSGGVRVRAR